MEDSKDDRILEAATGVFLRYGFRRTTMGDLAEAAGLSRPALYLRYCSKNHIFEAACRRFSTRIIEEIQEGLKATDDPLDQLHLAFDRWVVRPWCLVQDMPDARELAEGCPAVTSKAAEDGYAAFESILRTILEKLDGNPRFNASELAHLLASTARGLKTTARSEDELRRMVDGLLKLVATGVRG